LSALLSGLIARIETPPDLTEADLTERFDVVVREAAWAAARPLDEGEPVQAGDRLLLSLVAWGPADEAVGACPAWACTAEDPADGLATGWVGALVGQTRAGWVQLPPGALPLQPGAGLVRAHIWLDAAARPAPLQGEDADGLAQAAGLGPSAEAVMDSLLAQLQAERADALRASIGAQAVAQRVARVAPQASPAARTGLLDEAFSQHQAPLWARAGLGEAEIAAARARFVEDPALCAQAEARLLREAALDALSAALGPQAAHEAAAHAAFAAELGISSAELAEVLEGDVVAAEAFVASVRRDGALAALIAATAVEVDGALAPPLQ